MTDLLAAQFGMSRSAIRDIVNRRRWAHIGDTKPGVSEHPHAPGATAPPGAADDHPPGRRLPGGPKRGRSAVNPGKVAADRTTTEAAEQAAFEQTQADDDPGRFVR